MGLTWRWKPQRESGHCILPYCNDLYPLYPTLPNKERYVTTNTDCKTYSNIFYFVFVLSP